MARVTATEVKAIMDNCNVEDTVVETFIISGESVVSTIFENDTTVSTTFLKEIERWFVAHMIASTVDRTVDNEKVGDVTIKYTGQWGQNLASTPYGQMVLQLDTTGKIGKIGKKNVDIYAIKNFD